MEESDEGRHRRDYRSSEGENEQMREGRNDLPHQIRVCVWRILTGKLFVDFDFYAVDQVVVDCLPLLFAPAFRLQDLRMRPRRATLRP
jgi:hypothetical protein